LTIEIGKKVRAIRDLPYMGGQAPEDKIDEGELVTVERVAGGQLYFKEHADRYGGWPESEFIPDGMFWCPNCENPVSEVYTARSVKLEWNGQIWIETDVYSQGMSCPICNGDLDDSHLEPFGIRSPADGIGEAATAFYSLTETDILEVAASLEEELTPDEMKRAKDLVSEGIGTNWWEVTEIAIDTIKDERRKTDARG